MRVALIVLDSVGCGGAPDAERYGDAGADTLGHVLEACPGLRLPHLWRMGLGQVVGRDPMARPVGSWGRMTERSAGKDSTTGHWELAGVVLREAFATFEAFPRELLGPIEREAGVRFIGNGRASGTQIIEELGPRHMRTGELILYTSADSVLQIAAHEGVVGVERLYAVCEVARRHADAWRIGRVIARPFAGEPGRFERTGRRHDFSIVPPRTVLDALQEAGVAVHGIGKIGDLFAQRGLTSSTPTRDNAEGMAAIARVWEGMGEGLLMANLVDFDTEFGHRRDVAGYAGALGAFDAWLGGFIDRVRSEDMLIITADHGNDPTFRGTDHTRERVPVLMMHGGRAVDVGVRGTFADVAATVAGVFGVRWGVGRSMVAGARRGRTGVRGGEGAWGRPGQGNRGVGRAGGKRTGKDSVR